MSRIAGVFHELNQLGKTAFIPFITAGDPDIETSLKLMHTLVEKGADIIELGVPFSDPMADGSSVQLANERALKHNMNLRQVLMMVKSFRETNTRTPIVLMGYLNPIEMLGNALFAEMAAEADIDGVLCVDLPPEEVSDLGSQLRQQGIDTIYLLAPTSSEERMAMVAQMCSGYLYYVSLKGVTGAAVPDIDKVSERVNLIRRYTQLPIAVGFGIKDGKTAAAFASAADGVIVGSAVVNLIANNLDAPETAIEQVGELAASIREALDQTLIPDVDKELEAH